MTEILREARIVMPTLYDKGYEAHKSLEMTLTETFGGYTSARGQGGWMDGNVFVHDEIAIYDVAMEDTDANVDRLGEIALAAGRALGQKCVYLRRPDGVVRMLRVLDVPAAVLGTKRTPQPNEIWETRGGGKALVLNEVRDAGQRLYLTAVLLSRGDAAVTTPHRFSVFASGLYFATEKMHSFDLVKFDRTF